MISHLIDIFSDFLGEPRKHNEEKGQIAYDCPSCALEKDLGGATDGKGNLEINYKKGWYKCWACEVKSGTKGVVPKLIRQYGNDTLLKKYKILNTGYTFETDDKPVIYTETLPKGFMKLNEMNSGARGYTDAIKYLKQRRICDKIINKYNIGFINSGLLANRVVIPSYDLTGEVNYFIARAYFNWVRPKYLNSETPKQEIIFNESLINPYSTIYLVEGPFDSIVLPNSIPLLGLFLSDKLYWYLQNNAKADVVVILDGEAREEVISVYKKLNTLYLFNRVKVVFLKEGLDSALIYEKYGNRGIKTILRKKEKLDELKYYCS